MYRKEAACVGRNCEGFVVDKDAGGSGRRASGVGHCLESRRGVESGLVERAGQWFSRVPWVQEREADGFAVVKGRLVLVRRGGRTRALLTRC